MAILRLKTPVSDEDVQKLRVGDTFYVTGIVVTARDEAYKRAVRLTREGKKLPIDLKELVIFHCGPLMKREDEEWKVVAAGPTTSFRLEPLEGDFMAASGARIVIGKGGVGPETTEIMRKCRAVYGAFTGGAAVLAAKSIRSVRGVEWLDLGMPEALWILEVESFGPIIVAVDSHGNNLYNQVMMRVERNREKVYQRIGLEAE